MIQGDVRPAGAAILFRERPVADVHWSDRAGGWLVTRHADVIAGLREARLRPDDPLARLRRIASGGGPSLEHLRRVVSAISFFMLPPRHDAVRRLLAGVLHNPALAGLREELENLAQALIDAGRAAAALDLVAGYGKRLALFTMHRLLGVPLADCPELAAKAREVAFLFDRVPRPLRRLLALDHRLRELLDFFAQLIRERRGAPRDDGLSAMIAAADQLGGVSDDELAGFCTFFFVAGEETTGNGITAAAVMLAERPDLCARLAADAGRVADAARELLRLASPVSYITRQATEDFEFAGTPIRRGQELRFDLAAANRDPAVFANPNAIDIDRDAARAIPFGYGVYRCLGAGLATLEVEAAIAALVRCADLRLAPAAVTWENRAMLSAMASAIAVFVPSAVGARIG